jgi:hypothetical protein
MSDLFDAPATGAPRAGGVGVADAASWRGVAVAGAGLALGASTADGVAGTADWWAGLPPQRPADADPEDEEADDLDDDLDDDEDDDLDDLDDDDEDDDEDEDDDLDDEDDDLDDDDLDDDLVDLDDEYDKDEDEDRVPGRSDYESD